MTIDGKDIYTEWGCKLLEGSFDDLLKYPKRKAVKYNNWAEADGIDPDLSIVEFEPKTVKLKFLMKAETLEQFWSGYGKFVADLSAPGYREFNLIAGLTNRLRFNAGSSHEQPGRLMQGRTYLCLNFLLSRTTMPFIRQLRPAVSGFAGSMRLMG